MSEEQFLPGLQVKIGSIPKRVITCGDQERAGEIASLLDNAKLVQKNREYWTYTGIYKGEEIAVVSHGVGASGAMLAFIGLMKGGAEVIIRVGTAGGLNSDVKAGSLVIATGACREDGLTDIYVPRSFPAIADIDVTNALLDKAKNTTISVFDGVVITQGAFYGGILPTNTTELAQSGAIALEMELAALYIAASMYQKKAGSILAIDGSALAVLESAEDNNPDPEMLKRTVNESIKVGLDALVSIKI